MAHGGIDVKGAAGITKGNLKAFFPVFWALATKTHQTTPDHTTTNRISKKVLAVGFGGVEMKLHRFVPPAAEWVKPTKADMQDQVW